MKNRYKELKSIIGIMLSMFFILLLSTQTKAYDTGRIVKYDSTVTDISVFSFGNAYDQYIPQAIKAAFESEGGMIYVIPHNLVDSRVNLSGWANGNLENVTGYLDPNGGNPKIYLNSKVVDNAANYNPRTSDKVIIHEFGHFVCLEANKIRNKKWSYTFSTQMEAAFQSECNGYARTPSMMPVLISSFERNTSYSEFYANVFAAMIMDSANAWAAFPNSCAAISEDISLINSRFVESVSNAYINQSQTVLQTNSLAAQQQALILAQQQQQALLLAQQQQQALLLAKQQQALSAIQEQAIAAQQAQALAMQQTTSIANQQALLIAQQQQAQALAIQQQQNAAAYALALQK